MTNQFDLNKFNSFLDAANAAISCDTDCQKKKTEKELEKKYINAKSNLTLAKPQYQLAKQNYYTYVSGESGYNQIIEKELEKKADSLINKFKDDYNLEKTKILTQLGTYDGLLINFQNIVDLNEWYKKENAKLEKSLKEETHDVLTNERKTYYEDQQNDVLNFYYYYFLFTIYVIIVICFGIFSLIYPSTFSWKIRAFIFLVFAVLPFISTWLLGKIIQVIYWLFSLLPKNVYK
jgi:hypothetical protein